MHDVRDHGIRAVVAAAIAIVGDGPGVPDRRRRRARPRVRPGHRHPRAGRDDSGRPAAGVPRAADRLPAGRRRRGRGDPHGRGFGRRHGAGRRADRARDRSPGSRCAAGRVDAVYAAVLHEYGEAPRYEDSYEPSPEPGQVVVDVGAAALHHLDLFKASGNFYLEQPLPSVMGTRRRRRHRRPPRLLRRRRAPRLAGGARRRRGGGSVRRPRRARRPERRGDRQHWARRLAGALLARGSAARRDGRVLGATGQVGTVAVQAAKLLGAGRVIAVARAGERLDRMSERGADAVVDSRATTSPSASARPRAATST